MTESLGEEAHIALKMTVPEHLRPGLIRYFEHGIKPGSFLQALIQNNLAQTVLRADELTLPHLPNIVRWMMNEAPAPKWGSEDAMNAWINECAEARAE